MTNAIETSRKVGFQGYTTHRIFGGLRIPVPVQNLVMRDYAAKHNLMFLLSTNEFDFENCYLQLSKLARKLDRIEGVLMCSATMLPKEAVERRKIYALIFQNHSSVHFILDNMVVSDSAGADAVEEMLNLTVTLKECPTTIPESLLPVIMGLQAYKFDQLP